jgi:O-antigen ligase
VALLLAILLWSPLATGATRQGQFLVIQGLAIAAAVLWCARLWINPGARLLLPRMSWPVLLFAGYAVIRYFTSDLEYVSRQELIKVLVYVLVFCLALNHLHRHKPANFVLLTLILVATLIAGFAFYQFAAKHANYIWIYPRPAGYLGRGSGTFICPNSLAGYLGMLLPVALAFLFWGKQKWLAKIALGYAAVWLAAGIGVSLSRGGWVASLLGAGIFSLALLRQRRFQLIAVGAIACLIVAAIIFEAKTGIVHQRFVRDNPVNFAEQQNLRLNLWKSAFGLWQHHAVWGAGPGHFDQKFRPYRPVRLQGRPVSAHNDYLQVLAEYGLIGAALLGAGLALFARAMLHHWWQKVFLPQEEQHEHGPNFPLVIGGSIGVFVVLAHTGLDFHFQVPANAILAVTLLAVALVHAEGVQPVSRVRLRPAQTGIFTLVCVPVLLFLGWQLRAGCREWRWLERAEAARAQPERRLEALTRACQLEPNNYNTAFELGEACRLLSWEGTPGYEARALQAIEWFERSRRVNPYYPYSPLREGMCLDWLKRHDQARACFQKALELDPNNADTVSYLGWHCVQVGDYRTARELLLKAMEMRWMNPLSFEYLPIIEKLAKDPMYQR